MKPAKAYRKWLRSRREHEGNPRNQELELELNKSMKYDDEPICRKTVNNMVRDVMGWFTRWGISVTDEMDKINIFAIG